MSKILISGGLGNIGSNLARALLRKGHEILIFDYQEDFSTIKDIRDDIKVITGDIRDFEKVRRAIISVNGLVHLSAVSRVVWGYENPKECVDINIGGTVNVLEAARLSVRKPWIIFGSSREVYGEPEELPVDEFSPKKVKNIYGVTKLAGESLLEQYHRNYLLNGIILRFSNVYGSIYDQLDRVIPKFIIRAQKNQDLVLQGGKQVFDFTYIDDTIDAIVKSIEKLSTEETYFNDFNVVTGVKTPLKNLANLILELIGTCNSKLTYTKSRMYDVEKFYGNPSKAAEELGFKAQIHIREGLIKTIQSLKPILQAK